MGAGTNLAAYAASFKWSDVPRPLQAKLLDHIADTIGVMFAGIAVDGCVSARKAVQAWGQGQDATVAGLDAKYPTPTAAFLNALHGRIQNYDDTYEPGTVHPGAPVISAALALSEQRGVDGPTFLAAVLAGYEVTTRVAAAVSPGHYAKGFHNTGTCNVFGTAAAAARILGLDGEATAEALGTAGATSAGLRQHQLDGSMLDSAFHGARAAQSGVMVAQLRAEGVRGPPGILDGPMGFCTVMAPERDLSRLDAGLGSHYEFEQMSIKPYPICRFIHGSIAATLEMKREHKLDPARIKEFHIATFRQSVEVCDRPEIRTPYDAMMSHQYSVAVALLKDKLALESFSGEALNDRTVLDLMKKVRVTNDPELEPLFPKRWPHRLTAVMADGQRFSGSCDYPPGRVVPPSQDAIAEKFMEHAVPYLGPEKSRQALAMIRGLETCSNIQTLTAALRPSA